jgi:hypothetical protein
MDTRFRQNQRLTFMGFHEEMVSTKIQGTYFWHGNMYVVSNRSLSPNIHGYTIDIFG